MIICILDHLLVKGDQFDSFDNDRPSGIPIQSHSMCGLNSRDRNQSLHTDIRYYDSVYNVISSATGDGSLGEEYYIELGLSVNCYFDVSPTLRRLVGLIKDINNIHILFSCGWDMYSSNVYNRSELVFDRTAYLKTQLINLPNERLHFWLGNTSEVTGHKRMFPGADVQYYSVYPIRMARQHILSGLPFYKAPDISTVRDKAFLCLNNYEKDHRTAMVKFFRADSDLLSNAHVSYLRPRDPDMHMLVDGPKDPDKIGDWQDVTDYNIINNCYSYIATETHFDPTWVFSWNEQIRKHDHILFSKDLTEDLWDFSIPFAGWISEKSLKSAYYQLPLLVVGYPGSLDAFKKLGFKTFPEFFDEAYDTVAHPGERLKLIKDNINRLGNMSKQELHDLYHSERVQEKLQHNSQHFAHLIKTDPYLPSFYRLDICHEIQDFIKS
jgi:hypothetical protein